MEGSDMPITRTIVPPVWPRWRRRIRTVAAGAVLGALATASLLVALDGASAEPSPTSGRRVDLYTPTFNDPTRITNPLFPITAVRQAVQLGHDSDGSLRQEVTFLPETATIEWRGVAVETVVSQFVGYSDGRIVETALDHFAQDDRGAVWYFGEDVANYEDGALVDHEGSWRAGRDGPPGMIMPAHPHVGDVYRPENIPGLVFEEVVVRKVDQTVAGPRGRVHGAILVEEHPQDGGVEDKYFAPGYGEFDAVVASEDEHVTTAVANPIDRLDQPVPQDQWTLSSGARRIFDTARERDWTARSADVHRVAAAWDRLRSHPVPPLLVAPTTDAIAALRDALAAHDVTELRQASVDLAHAAFDLQMQHRDPVSLDRDRIVVWKRQLVLDARAEDMTAVDSDLVVLEAIGDRIERGADD
jgi:hypothetical protein